MNILIGKQWYQMPEIIPSNSDSVLHSCISISIHTQVVVEKMPVVVFIKQQKLSMSILKLTIISNEK